MYDKGSKDKRGKKASIMLQESYISYIRYGIILLRCRLNKLNNDTINLRGTINRMKRNSL